MRSMVMIGLASILLASCGSYTIDDPADCPTSFNDQPVLNKATYTGRLNCGYPDISSSGDYAIQLYPVKQSAGRDAADLSRLVVVAIVAAVYLVATRPKPG